MEAILRSKEALPAKKIVTNIVCALAINSHPVGKTNLAPLA